MLLAAVRKMKVHRQERARRLMVLLPLFLQLYPRVTVMVAAGASAGGTKAEHQPAAACWRLVLGLDTGGWDGCRVAGVLVHVGHLEYWRVVVGHLLQQLGGLAVPIFAVRTSEI